MWTKKYFFSGFFICLLLGSLLFYQSRLPYDAIKEIALYQLKKNLNQPCHIHNVSGSLFKDIVFHDVIIKDKENRSFVTIKKLTVSFNLLKLFSPQTPLTDVITELQIEEGRLLLYCNKKGIWNVSELKTSSESKNQKINFSGKIIFNHFAITYIDEYGFGDTPLQTPFIESWLHLFGTMDFKNPNVATLTLKGRSVLNKAPVILNGALNKKQFFYNVDFQIYKFNLKEWGHYILPFKGVELGDGNPLLYGNIRHRPIQKYKKDPAIWYELNLLPQELKVWLPFLASPIKELTGKITFSQGKITPVAIEKIVKDPWLSKKILAEIKTQGWVSQNGDIQATNLTPNALSPAVKKYETQLFSLFKHPPIELEIKNAKAILGLVKLTGLGKVNFSEEKLDLQLFTSEFDVENLKNQIVHLQSLKAKGRAFASVLITGSFKDPVFKGVASANNLIIYGLNPKKVALSYKIEDQILEFQVPSASIFGGSIEVKGKCDVRNPIETLKIKAQGKQWQLSSMANPNISGELDMTTELQTTTDYFEMNILIKSHNALFFNQTLQEVSGTLLMDKNGLLNNVSLTALINENTSPLFIKGTRLENQWMSLLIEGKNIVIQDPNPPYPLLEKKGRLNVTANIVTPLDEKLWTLSYIQATINATIFNYVIANQAVDSIFLNLGYKNGTLSIYQAEAKKDSQSINITGEWSKTQPSSVKVEIQNWQISSENTLQKLLPRAAQPLQGPVSGVVFIEKTAALTPKTTLKGALAFDHIQLGPQPLEEVTVSFNMPSLKAGTLDVIAKEKNSEIHCRILLSDLVSVWVSPSKIDLINFSPLWEEHEMTLTGLGIFSGQLLFKNQDIKTDVTASIQNLIISNTHIGNVDAKISLQNKNVLIQELKIAQENALYKMKGDIATSKNYALSIHILNGQLDTLKSWLGLLKESQEKWSKKTKTILDNTPHPVDAITDTSSIKGLLWSLEHPNHQSQFIKKIQDTLKDEKSSFKSQWEKIKGIVNGDITIKSNPDILPEIESKLTIQNLVTKSLSFKRGHVYVYKSEDQNEYDLSMEDGLLFEKPFEDIIATGSYTPKGFIQVKHSLVKTKKTLAKNPLLGQIPLQAFLDEKTNAPLNIRGQFSGNDINIITLFFPQILEIQNKGDISFTLSGPLTSISIPSGNLSLKNASITFSKNILSGAKIKISSGNIDIKENQINLRSIQAFHALPNKEFDDLSLEGHIRFSKLNLMNSQEWTMMPNLLIRSPEMTLDLPNLYEGRAKIKQLHLKGVYALSKGTPETLEMEDHADKLELKGELTLEKGTLSIPSTQESAALPLSLDLKVNIGQQVAFNTAVLGSGAFSGLSIDLDLEKTNTPLFIQGSTLHPKIFNQLTFKDGNIQLLNRTFNLIPLGMQKNYQEDLSENSITFKGVLTDKNAPSVINISALAIIEKPLDKTTLSSKKTPVYQHVVAQLKGPITKPDTIQFTIFESEFDRINPSDLKRVNSVVLNTQSNQTDSSETVLKILFPEIINFAEKNTLSKEDTSQLINELGEQRLNAFVKKGIRPLEKQIAKGIGLQDLRVDYNLGAEFFKQQDVHRVVGVNMIKNLTDQLFLRVKTNLDLRSEQKSNQTIGLSEIEMTYAILPNILFFNYAEIKDDNAETFRPKLSLRFRYEY